MTPFFVTIFFLPLSSLATAANFTLVYEWPDGLDYEWPSEESRTQAIKDGTFDPKAGVKPLYMAVYGTRLFLSLSPYNQNYKVSLVSLPTNSASSAPPKLTPFPSWDTHLHGNQYCNKIKEANGLEVDSAGRLWVLDRGNNFCKSKIWIIDLNKNDRTELIHQFSFHDWMHDLVLDEMSNNGTFAYISRWEEQNIVVFSLERNESWIVKTPGVKVFSIALSPKDEEPSQLYLGSYHSNELYSIPVAALRSRVQSANPKLIGRWAEEQPYRMLIDNHGTMYTAFLWAHQILSWDTYQPFQEKHFRDVAGLYTNILFTFALDQNGTLWMTEIDEEIRPRYTLRLLQVTPTIPNTTTKVKTEKSHLYWPFKFILIYTIVINLILRGI